MPAGSGRYGLGVRPRVAEAPAQGRAFALLSRGGGGKVPDQRKNGDVKSGPFARRGMKTAIILIAVIVVLIVFFNYSKRKSMEKIFALDPAQLLVVDVR